MISVLNQHKDHKEKVNDNGKTSLATLTVMIDKMTNFKVPLLWIFENYLSYSV